MRKSTFLSVVLLFIAGTLSAFADGRLQSTKAGSYGGDGPFKATATSSEFEIILDSAKLPDLTPGMKIKSVTFRGANDIANLKYTFTGYIGSTKSEAKYGEDLQPLAKPADAVDIESTTITLPEEGDVEAWSNFDNTATDLVTIPVSYTYNGGNIVLRLNTTADASNAATSSSPKFTVSSSWSTTNCLLKYTASGYATDWSRASYQPVVYLNIDGDVVLQPRTLTGKVTNYTTSEPIADVKVEITNVNDSTGANTLTVTTDAEGNYTATLDAGVYSVLAVKDGYKADEDSWTNAAPQADVTLGSATLDLTMRKIYNITIYADSDNTDSINAADRNPANITLKRSFKAGEWTTLCLPFQLSNDIIKESFGEGTEVVSLDDVQILKDSTYLVVGKQDLYYDYSTGYVEGQYNTQYGNTPFLIKSAKNLDEVKFNDVLVNAPSSWGMGKSVYDRKGWTHSIRMEGTYAPKTTGDNEYALVDTAFVRPSEIKATMAYIKPDIITEMILQIDDHIYGDTAIHNQTTDTTVVVKKEVQITGVVYIEGGENAPGATVTAVSTDDPTLVVTTKADEEGTYSFKLLEGEYDVTASLDGYLPDTKHITVTDTPGLYYFVLKPDPSTGISSIKNSIPDNAPVYNLNGIKVQNGINGLKKGVYIINHHKFVVK